MELVSSPIIGPDGYVKNPNEFRIKSYFKQSTDIDLAITKNGSDLIVPLPCTGEHRRHTIALEINDDISSGDDIPDKQKEE